MKDLFILKTRAKIRAEKFRQNPRHTLHKRTCCNISTITLMRQHCSNNDALYDRAQWKKNYLFKIYFILCDLSDLMSSHCLLNNFFFKMITFKTGKKIIKRPSHISSNVPVMYVQIQIIYMWVYFLHVYTIKTKIIIYNKNW